MSDRLLVRNVPAEVHQWIKQQRQQQQMSQQEFLLSLLHPANAAQQGPMLPFESFAIEVPVPMSSSGDWAEVHPPGQRQTGIYRMLLFAEEQNISMARREWTRDELILAFNLYCKIPFGKIHIRNPLVIGLAKAIGRTPSAVSWKLANFARLDPALRQRKIVGAAHGAKGEIRIWEEFNHNWEGLAFESEKLLGKKTGQRSQILEETKEFPEGLSRETLIRARVNQGFFRKAVLAAYELRCCITGLSVVELLNASHIVPWVVDIKNRTNPRNGLCLSVIHDRAFDCGLLTIALDLTVQLSPRLKAKSTDTALKELLCKYDGVSISVPSRFPPDPEFLRFHNEKIFLRS